MDDLSKLSSAVSRRQLSAVYRFPDAIANGFLSFEPRGLKTLSSAVAKNQSKIEKVNLKSKS